MIEDVVGGHPANGIPRPVTDAGTPMTDVQWAVHLARTAYPREQPPVSPTLDAPPSGRAHRDDQPCCGAAMALQRVVALACRLEKVLPVTADDVAAAVLGIDPRGCRPGEPMARLINQEQL
ncbi:hypothetical protein ACFYY8_31425 [Streptosporangium sp. NPDC001559]|uniref:hypothetical protein n=1 Tax=Streptosporangium sp. NPDC001559 TaxID=3366187 RepID=UPI0036EADC1F